MDRDKYRYKLTRRWDEETKPARILAWCMLNPSTADEIEDDPTIRRCISFSKREDYQGLVVVNLFAARATKPTDLLSIDDPIGRDNWKFWVTIFASPVVDCVVCGWGANVERHPEGTKQVERFFHLAAQHDVHLVCLGTTMAGHPRHPLYVKNDQPMQVIS